MKSTFNTLIVLLLFVVAAVAQPINFESLNGPNGGYVSSFHLNGQGTIIAEQSHLPDIHRISFDGGDSWSMISGSFLNFSTSVHPDGSFYQHKLGTNKFTKIPLGSSSVEEITYDSLNQSRIKAFTIDENGDFYAVNYDDELFKSEDVGQSWTYLMDATWSSNVYVQKVHAPKGEDYIYFHMARNGSLQNLIYRMKKDGSAMEVSYNSQDQRIFGFCHVSGVGFFLTRIASVYHSTDGAPGSWNLIGSGFETLALACTPQGDLTVGGSDGYFRSTDLGANWTPLQGPRANRYLGGMDIQFSPTLNRYIVENLSSETSNFYSVSPDFTDWESIIPKDNAPPVSRVFVDGAENIYAGIRAPNGSEIEGWHRSTDGGDTFEHFYLPKGVDIRAIDKGANDVLFAFGYNDSLYMSLDHGDTWTLNMPDNITFNPQGQSRFSYVKAHANGVILANFDRATNDKLRMSTDNGTTWKVLDYRHYYENNIDIHPNGDIYGTFFQNGGGRLLVKYDQQTAQWDTIFTNGSTLRSVMISETGVVYVEGRWRGQPGYIITEDEGVTFFGANWINFNYITSTPNGFLIAASGDQVILSKNGGLSWERIYLHDIPGPNIRGFFVNDSSEVYIAFSGDYIHKSEPLDLYTNYITGNVFFDSDEDCSYDSTELQFENIIVQAAGADTFYVTTRYDGYYSIPVPDGTYDVSITMDKDYWEPCDSVKTVTVSNGSTQSGILFPVKAKVLCPNMSVDLTNSFLRRCFPNNYHVRYCNEGTVTGNDVYVEITLDPRMTITASDFPWTSVNGSTYTFDLGDVPIFTCGKFKFTTEMDCDSVMLGETICAEANIFPDSICQSPDPNWNGASLRITGECEGDTVTFNIKNVGVGDMDQTRNYIIIEDVALMRVSPPFNLNAGDDFDIKVPVSGQTVHIETAQVDGHPGNSMPSLTVERCGDAPFNLGFFNQFGQNDLGATIDIECREVVGAYDPNDKNAVPKGIDVEHKIQPNSTIEYLIRFQNTGTDTAFNVVIIDTLSHLLNVTSFTAGASSHDYDFDISEEGIVQFNFKNIMLPDSNVNQLESNGFVKYKIAMQPNAPLGKTILNAADIYFDFNDPIYTNQTYHLIDQPWVTVKTEETFVENVDVQVYPNPFTERATFDLKNAPFGEKQFRLFSLSGNAITTQTFDNQQFVFQRNHLPKGLYIYEIKKGDMKIAAGKLVVQ